MSVHETPLTRAFWDRLGEGALYEEFPVVDQVRGLQSRRVVDGMVLLGEPKRLAARGERASLDDRDIVVIQTKATRLNPHVFGQALLSPELITLRWRPRSLRSVLLCTADDPELRPFVADFPEVEIHVVESPRTATFTLRRVPGAAARVAARFGGARVAPAQLTARLKIDGVLLPAVASVDGRPLAELVAGQDVISVHSFAQSLGMWVSGEVIVAQKMLTRRGAASVRSVIVCQQGDEAVETALRRYASFEVDEVVGRQP